MIVLSPVSKRRLAAVLVSTVGLCAVASVAHAQQQTAGALRQACTSDAKSFCAGTRPGGGRIIQCLRQNAPKLSPNCQQALAALQSKTPVL